MMRRNRHKAGARRRFIAKLDRLFARWLGISWSEANRKYEVGEFGEATLARVEIEKYRWLLGDSEAP